MNRFAFAFLLLAGCPPKTPTAPISAWELIPRLPSPSASTYNRSREAPPDPPVAHMVRDLAWDASLSGAAAGLALQLIHEKEPTLTRWRVREALWRAGYPYPPTDARAWQALPDGGPPPQLITWLEGVTPADDLGLVRARGHDGDFWVALSARPAASLGPIPRQVATGASMTLPALPGATWTVADANGLVRTGSLDEAVTLEAGNAGEWMVRVDAGATHVATFPIYVGMVPPKTLLLQDVAPLGSSTDVVGRTEALLTGIRDVYGARPLARDFMLDAGARSLLQGNAGSASGVVASLGLDPERTALWTCDGTTVEACLDGMIWEPSNRRALLDDASSLGLAADLAVGGVRLVGIMSTTR